MNFLENAETYVTLRDTKRIPIRGLMWLSGNDLLIVKLLPSWQQWEKSILALVSIISTHADFSIILKQT